MADKRGFSLLEAFIALGVGAVFLSSVVSTWYFASDRWRAENTRFDLRMDIEKAMERIKNDVRLSDANGILYYPQNASSYTAISLPHATPDANGYLTFSNNLISWNQTIIYYVYNNNGRYELRRRVTASFNSNQSARQTELDTLALNGPLGLPQEVGTTDTVLVSAGNLALDIVPQAATFDGYDPAVTRSGSTSFGSVRLTAGNHQVRFEVTGKNASSSSHGIGIDSLTLSPSGGPQEAEALLPIYASLGAAPAAEDMTPYTGVLWGGNYQVNFPSTAVGHYMTFQTYYDQWLESNFANMTFSNTLTTGTNPYVTLSSRETQSLSPSWTADAQTLSGGTSNDATASTMSVRSIVSAGYITKSGVMARIKFLAASDATVTVNSAYFGPRVAGTADAASLAPLYFDNAPVVEASSDPVGSTANPGSATSVTIPAGYHAWSNWFIYPINSPSAADYLVSMYVTGNATAWTPNPVGGTQSYRVSGDNAAVLAGWSILPGYATNQSVYASAQLATWQNTGTATSQIYDTKMTAPVYAQASWSATLPAGSLITMKARSSSAADMSGATAWGSIVGSAVSPMALGGIGNQRYVQFQATLQAGAPYATFPELDDVKITWPGQTALVEFSGYYTKKPSYGIFKVLVDGAQLTKGLEIKLTASEIYRGQTYNFSLNAEQKAMNTGK
ncbi:MAG: hypothetical protein HYZ52_02320 [Candidatus Omnitrophica bacterium]|nr:hypothetical protein [Candidatus Omnitrophota bacterium]